MSGQIERLSNANSVTSAAKKSKIPWDCAVKVIQIVIKKGTDNLTCSFLGNKGSVNLVPYALEYSPRTLLNFACFWCGLKSRADSSYIKFQN